MSKRALLDPRDGVRGHAGGFPPDVNESVVDCSPLDVATDDVELVNPGTAFLLPPTTSNAAMPEQKITS